MAAPTHRAPDHLEASAARTTDPAAASAAMARLWSVAPDALRQRLLQDHGLTQALLAVMASSEFLAEALVQSPDLALWLDAQRRLPTGRAREDWGGALGQFAAAAAANPAERARALIAFKRRECLRIAWRDLSGEAALGETTQDLSQLADAILQQAYAWAWNDLANQYGTPRLAGGGAAEMTVIALGKLGAEELNYSSDIDLMFVHAGDGETSGGAVSVGNREFFALLAQAVTRYASALEPGGPAYRVDLRLRPGGREGELVQSLEAAVAYYRGQAREWELQMLIRARGSAGSKTVAAQFLDQVRQRVYPTEPQPEELALGVRESRAKISAQVARHRSLGRKSAALDVKLDPGGIRDIEFLAQYLQRRHGGAEPWLRSGNTLIGLQRLYDKRLLPTADWQQLAATYTLLRHLEHRLQLRMGQQTHALPASAERRAALARSLEAVLPGRYGALTAQALDRTLQSHMQAALDIYRRYLEPAPDPAAAAALPSHGSIPPEASQSDWPANLRRNWDRLWQSAATQEGGQERLQTLPEPAVQRLRFALNASDWMAEALIRRPQAVSALAQPPQEPAEWIVAGDADAQMTALRDGWLRQTLRLLLAEWDQQRPIAAALRAHSRIAEEVLQAALRCVPEAPASLAVLALGRLGLGELDLQSDLDLVFVAEWPEREPAARAAAKLIHVLTAYTQAGALYAVDTRLRPRGREGELVQTAASLEQHLREHADAWEGVSYLKARWAAGNARTAEVALASIRAASVARFAGKSLGEDLRALRGRMEREGRPGRWGLKTGPGGYYDVDFLASRRWLEAGLAAPVGQGLAATVAALPEPWLPRAVASEAAELTELLRASDHALRVATGHAGHRVPAAGAAVERAWDWLARTARRPRSQVGAGLVDRARARLHEIYSDLL